MSKYNKQYSLTQEFVKKGEIVWDESKIYIWST